MFSNKHPLSKWISYPGLEELSPEEIWGADKNLCEIKIEMSNDTENSIKPSVSILFLNKRKELKNNLRFLQASHPEFFETFPNVNVALSTLELSQISITDLTSKVLFQFFDLSLPISHET